MRRKHNRRDNKSELLQYKLLYCSAAAAAATFIHPARQFARGVPAARARLIIIVAPDGRELDPNAVRFSLSNAIILFIVHDVTCTRCDCTPRVPLDEFGPRGGRGWEGTEMSYCFNFLKLSFESRTGHVVAPSFCVLTADARALEGERRGKQDAS